jgi:hypothetical protein
MLGLVRANPILLVALAAAGAAPAAPAAYPGASAGEVDPEIADGSAQRRLDAARERWRDTGLRSYRFRVRRECFCPLQFTAPALIVVRHGDPVDPPRRLRGVATVPRLQRKVQRAIDHRVEGLTVRYSRRGVPRAISINPSTMIADEEVGFFVDRFRPR